MAQHDKERSPARDDDAAIVERLVKQLRPTDRTVAAAPAPRPPGPRADRPAVNAGPPRRPIPAPAQAGPAGIWARVALGTLLGIALTQWPYARTCGWWLLFYLGAVAILVVAGLWGALLSWERRLGLAHVVALATIFWGLALTAHEILPRVGYAKVPAAWHCVEPGPS